MADLVTHVCTALLPAALVRVRGAGLVVVGTVLPDVFGRVVPLALEQGQRIGLPIPVEAVVPWGILHTPTGGVVLAATLATAFVPQDRGRAFVALTLGIALHLALDVLQFHHGQGYTLLVPWSWATFELGWIGSEATVPWALPLLGATAVAWIPRGLRRGDQAQGADTRQG